MGDEIWKSFWKWLFIAITCIVLSFTGCNMHIDYSIRKSIEAGANPIDARIAFSNSTPTTQVIVSKMVELGKN
jgi:hypothetical protein